jgi:hypothetical protein
MDESFDLDSPRHSPMRSAQTVPIAAEADDVAATATQVDAAPSAAAAAALPASPAAVPAMLSSLSAAIAALAAGLDEQQAHLSAASSDLSAHFAQQSSSSSSLPAHRRPDVLLARLHALSSIRLPTLAKRQAALTEAQAPVLQEVERLMAANRALLADMHARVGNSSSNNSNIHASSSFATPATDALLATIPVATPSKASPSALLSARSSAAAPPSLALPSAAAAGTAATATPAAAAATTTATRRKSARPLHPAPPSPRDSSAAALLSEVVEEGPVSDREFAGVSSTVKSRVKLGEVNQLLGVIQNHFARIVANQAALSVGSGHGGRKSIGGAAAAAVAAAAASIDPASLPPLTLTTLSELGGAGKIGGATSQCIIGTLRACKRILVDRRGILLVKLPPPYSASAAGALAK